MNNAPLNIAVVGSGAAGLTVTHLLQQKHRVTLLEKNERLGGHTNTFVLPDGPDAGTPVDTGFIVMNDRNYPLLSRLFGQLGVELRNSDMSFGYHDVPTGLQYCGNGLAGLFAQRANLFKPGFLRMVRDTLRFSGRRRRICRVGILSANRWDTISYETGSDRSSSTIISSPWVPRSGRPPANR